MNKEATDSILEYVKVQAIDILGYVPSDNDLDGVLSNILDDIQTRVLEYTDFMTTEYNIEL